MISRWAGTSVDDSSALLLRLKFGFMRFVFYLEELFLRRVTIMFSASGKAMNMKIISRGGGGGGTVTALFKQRTTKLSFLSKLNCTLSPDAGKKAWRHNTSDKFWLDIICPLQMNLFFPDLIGFKMSWIGVGDNRYHGENLSMHEIKCCFLCQASNYW